MTKLPILLFFALVISGCARPNLRENATNFASGCGFTAMQIPTENFTLYALYKSGASTDLHVYIEGDGRAWINRTTPSNDPTPHNPVALYLAVNDPTTAHILYLARPCQYVMDGRCRQKYWTNARMGENVIESLDDAITHVKKAYGLSHVKLVGFSGGGGCAAILASRRDDVTFLGTVAGNLDIGAWTKLHSLSPLDQSLEPLSVAPQLHHLPQRHYSGQEDNIIPPMLSQRFCIATGRPEACQSIPKLTHGGAWQKVWNYAYD